MTIVRKVLIFLVACVTLNSIIVEGSFLGCDPIKDQQSVTWEDFLGFWYVKYIPVYLSWAFNHITINFTRDGSLMYMTETANMLLGDGKPQIHVRRSLSIPIEGSTVIENIGFPLNLLDSEITFISKDPKCYLLFQHCVKAINIAEEAIAFRDQTPTKECEDAALAAYKEAGLDESSITKDKSFE